MGKENGDSRDGEFDNQTFLYIRTHPADDGSTPLAAGLECWLSPDITIIRPDGTRGSEGAVGENDQVEVVVSNKGGIDAVDAYVEAFLADPSTAFTPATAMLVGSGFLTVPNHMLAPILFPWTPTPADAGHRCMLARVCLSVPHDCYADPTIFDVPGDRHVAQRNLNVVGFQSDTLSFRFLIANPLKSRREFVLRAAEMRGERSAGVLRGTLGSRAAQLAEAPLGRIGLALDEPVPLSQEPGVARALPTGILGKGRVVPRTRTVQLELRRGEQRHAVLAIARNRSTRRGDFSVVQVEQVDTKTERVVGGLWLAVQH